VAFAETELLRIGLSSFCSFFFAQTPFLSPLLAWAVPPPHYREMSNRHLPFMRFLFSPFPTPLRFRRAAAGGASRRWLVLLPYRTAFGAGAAIEPAVGGALCFYSAIYCSAFAPLFGVFSVLQSIEGG